MIKRKLYSKIKEKMSDKKAVLLLGPRQCGKTTLAKMIAESEDKKILWLNGDEFDVREKFIDSTSTQLKNMIGNNDILVIDEAQRIENIGLSIKLIVDNIDNVKVIATGSSSFELSSLINEPLTGRKWEYTLLPFSFGEMVDENGELEERRLLNERLVFGYYPDVVNNPSDKFEVLNELTSSYLYKDILSIGTIKKSEKLEKLVQAIAFQVGNQVSYNELGQMSGLDNQTVEKYIDLLEKAFILFRLTSFSRNLRNEIKKSRKIYFYDNGIRNAVINSLNPIELRNDIGALWENFLISERKKRQLFNRKWSNNYFWRTHSQQEVDYIEEYNGQLHAYEFKWNPNAKVKPPKIFLETYGACEFKVVTPKNFIEFLI